MGGLVVKIVDLWPQTLTPQTLFQTLRFPQTYIMYPQQRVSTVNSFKLSALSSSIRTGSYNVAEKLMKGMKNIKKILHNQWVVSIKLGDNTVCN